MCVHYGKAVDTFPWSLKRFAAIILSKNMFMHSDSLLYDGRSLTQYVKPCVTFEGSRTEKQLPP